MPVCGSCWSTATWRSRTCRRSCLRSLGVPPDVAGGPSAAAPVGAPSVAAPTGGPSAAAPKEVPSPAALAAPSHAGAAPRRRPSRSGGRCRGHGSRACRPAARHRGACRASSEAWTGSSYGCGSRRSWQPPSRRPRWPPRMLVRLVEAPRAVFFRCRRRCRRGGEDLGLFETRIVHICLENYGCCQVLMIPPDDRCSVDAAKVF